MADDFKFDHYTNLGDRVDATGHDADGNLKQMPYPEKNSKLPKTFFWGGGSGSSTNHAKATQGILFLALLVFIGYFWHYILITLGCIALGIILFFTLKKKVTKAWRIVLLVSPIALAVLFIVLDRIVFHIFE